MFLLADVPGCALIGRLCSDKMARKMPGRVIGMSVTVEGTPGLRLAMQVGNSVSHLCSAVYIYNIYQSKHMCAWICEDNYTRVLPVLL